MNERGLHVATGLLVFATVFLGVPCQATQASSPLANVLSENLQDKTATTEVDRETDLELILHDRDQLARLGIRVEVHGRTTKQIWTDTFRLLLDFVDRDNNGRLSREEVLSLPSPYALRQNLWGQIVPYLGKPLPWQQLDPNVDGEVSETEVATFYRHHGFGSVSVAIGKSVAASQLHHALLERLDRDKNGTIDFGEISTAEITLFALDSDRDELVGAGELVPGITYPGASGTLLLKSSEPAAPPLSPLHLFPNDVDRAEWIKKHFKNLYLPPERTGDSELLRDNALQAKQAIHKDRQVKNVELESIEVPLAEQVWRVRLNSETEIETTGLPEQANPSHRVHGLVAARCGRLCLTLRATHGKLASQLESWANELESQIMAADSDSNGEVSSEELESVPSLFHVQQLAALADRNHDSKLSRTEFTQWLELKRQIVKGFILLTVLDCGKGLFETLDINHDGSLSRRELKSAPETLIAYGCLQQGGRIDLELLPHHLLSTVSHGHPVNPLGEKRIGGPSWFIATDRNRDGEISRTEFLGEPEDFDRLDKNNDNFISIKEVVQDN